MNNENTYGYVYILVSDKTPYIKIGGTGDAANLLI